MDTDEQLFQRYLTGDELAFSELYRRLEPRVMRIVRGRVFDPIESEDLVQQTFTSLHSARSNYRAGSQVRPWVHAIALNVCRDSVRRRRRRPESGQDMDLLTSGPVSPTPRELGETHPALRAALGTLSVATRQIFREHFLAGRALSEIARELGEKPGTVRVRVHRGCQALRIHLSETACVRL